MGWESQPWLKLCGNSSAFCRSEVYALLPFGLAGGVISSACFCLRMGVSQGRVTLCLRVAQCYGRLQHYLLTPTGPSASQARN